MPTSQSTRIESCTPRNSTPFRPPPDPLYSVFEDAVATVEMLVFPTNPEISTSPMDNSSQDFLEEILDQLIEWGGEYVWGALTP